MSKIKKVILCCLSIPLIILSMCPTFAYAADNSFKWECPEPYVDSHNAYLALNFGNGEGYIYRFSFYPITNDETLNDIHDIEITLLGFNRVSSENVTNINYYVLTNAVIGYYLSVSVIYPDGYIYYFPLKVIDGPSGGMLQFDGLKYLHNYTMKGNIFVDGDSNWPSTYSMIPVWGDQSDYTSYFQNIISKLTTLHSDNLELINLFVDALNNLATLHTDNVDQLGKLVEIINGVVQLHSDNVEILAEMAELLSECQDIRNILDMICNYLTVDQFYLLWELDYELMDINDKLDTIIEILRSSGESNLTSPDSSNVDDYYEIEQGLINRSDVDVSNVVNVQIDQNAMSFTWNLLDAIMNSNGKVFGLTLTVLSLGIIALILGR